MTRSVLTVEAAGCALAEALAIAALPSYAQQQSADSADAAAMTRAHESTMSRDELHALADHVHPINDVGAPIASGSFRTMGMLIAPCSVRSLAEVATGVTTTLLTRAADVVLKERCTLVMMVREAPLHAGHLRNMLAATEMGAIIHPPVPAFYTEPKTISDMVDHTLGRVLDCFGLEMPNMPRWGEPGMPKDVEAGPLASSSIKLVR